MMLRVGWFWSASSTVVLGVGAVSAGAPPGGAVETQPHPATAGGQKLEEMMVEAPAMTEEDQFGYNMPKQYMCNACRSVIWHLNATMTVKHPAKRNWKEWEVEEVIGKTCSPDTFDGYGIKKMGGENNLSGPALKEEEDALLGGQASIQMGGDSWKKRMAEVCRKLTGDELQDEVYELWRNRDLTQQLCYDRLKYCAGGKKKSKDKKKKESKEKKEKKEKKPKATEKKVSLDSYLRKVARAKGWSEERFAKARSETEWSLEFKDLDLTLPGSPTKEEL